MLKVNSYSNKGVKSTATVTLPKEWEAKANPSLLAQAIRVYIDRSHFGLRKSQTRSEVNRTTKKLYSQKGTGGARHGSRSAPIFVGGGVAHGPRPVSRELTLPLAMRRKAMAIAMSDAVNNERVIVSDLNFTKTNDAQKLIEKVAGSKDVKVTFVVKKENWKNARFMRNIKNARVINFMDLNAYEVCFGGKIILDKDIFGKETKEKKGNKK